MYATNTETANLEAFANNVVDWAMIDASGSEFKITPRAETRSINNGSELVNIAVNDALAIAGVNLADAVYMEGDFADAVEEVVEAPDPFKIGLKDFLDDFGVGLFDAVSQQNTPISTGIMPEKYLSTLAGLTRSLFEAQEKAVAAVMSLLVDHNQPAAIINGEMGTGKTMMAIATAALMQQEGYKRTLVLCPPHLVYKWRREIVNTIPNARVWILNGTDTLAKLVKLRQMFRNKDENVPEFFILGRIRMRMGFHWRPSYVRKQQYEKVTVFDQNGKKQREIRQKMKFVCSSCGKEIIQPEKGPFESEALLIGWLNEERRYCQEKLPQQKDRDGNLLDEKICNSPLWTLCRKNQAETTPYQRTFDAITRLPTIGKKTAEKLLKVFGDEKIAEILEDNVMAFANLMDDHGNFVFTDAQARRLERALGKMEFSAGQGGYQATEYIKRYLPKNYFGLMVVDEAHEYKNYGTAQGQAMGVLCRMVNKILPLTGTLMGGYAEDIFYLLWRINPKIFIEDGFTYNKSRSLGSASMSFMREYGVVKETIKTGTCSEDGSFSSSRAKRSTVTISKAPGFSPLGIMRYILPMTVFVKIADLGGELPPYEEIFRAISLSDEQNLAYDLMEKELTAILKDALKKRDTTLTSTVMNALLSWPEVCYEDMSVYWKRKGEEIYYQEAVVDDKTPTPKEIDVIEVVKEELAQNRRVLVYSVYSGKKDTTTRLAKLLKQEGIKAGVLKSTVKADEREDWVAEQLDKGIQVLICNPELVKTGLDLLEFPTIYFMTTGYNVYTLMQAARRSWRIGQTEDVKVYFGGYFGTAQQSCLELMSQKISVTQSTSGDMPECGLDILNQSGDSVEVELARKLIEQAAA